MAGYRRLFIYRKNINPVHGVAKSTTLSLLYNIQSGFAVTLSLLYNISTGNDARTLFEEKEPGNAIWYEPDPADPTEDEEL